MKSGLLLLILAVANGSGAIDLRLPLKDHSVRFAVIGDNGTGGAEEYQVAEWMEKYREVFPFTFVVMLGDNIYGGHSPADLEKKFAVPYKALLENGVQFYASLGNHDDPKVETRYPPFHMNGERYYTFQRGNAKFFALDSSYMDPAQVDWIQKALGERGSDWKICFFHHPLYDDAKFHGPDVALRAELEPIFVKTHVDLVLNGHEHVYERIKPQKNIYYFILGNSGQLRPHNLRAAAETARGFDTDRDFMMMEISGDQLYFQTVSRTGETIDSGVLNRQK